MRAELQAALQTDYGYAIEAQVEDDAQAEIARKSGDLSTYFDLAPHLQLADVCWALEKWDEAKHWYRHNAQVMMEGRALRTKRGPHLMEALSDWEASTLIKAGALRAGRRRVRAAIEHKRKEEGSEIVLAQLGLHAAQAGLAELGNHAASIVKARAALPGGGSQAIDQARRLLHFEPAQVALLLGRWDDFEREAAAFREVSTLVRGNEDLAFPAQLQNALLAACGGFAALAALRAGKTEAETGRQTARDAFEQAILHFYRFTGQWDCNVYFMRLNTRFADELAAGRPPDPNPFADR